MIAKWLKVAVRWGLRSLVLVIVVGTAHVTFMAWRHRAPAGGAASTPAASAGELPFGLSALASRLVPSLPRDLLSPEGSSSAGAPSQPRRRQTYLVVNVADARSEVLIDGITRGHTPYVGEVSCEPGSTITISVLPKDGMPRRFERLCDRREIRIVDDVPP